MDGMILLDLYWLTSFVDMGWFSDLCCCAWVGLLFIDWRWLVTDDDFSRWTTYDL